MELSEVPNDIPSNVRTVKLSHNSINTVEEGDFVDLTSLDKLYLRYNAISAIHNYAFVTTAMEELYMSYNRLSRLPALLGIEDTLEILYLNGNKLVYVGDELTNHSLLHQISFKDNLINSVSLTAFCGTMLSILDFSYNKFTTIPNLICIGSTLTNLALYGNEIMYVNHTDLAGLVHLKEINLSFNEITYIDDYSFHNLVSLSHIWLQDNRLTHIPDNAFLNTSLFQLKVNDNELDSVPNFTAIENSLGILNALILDVTDLEVLPSLVELTLYIKENVSVSCLSDYFPVLEYLKLVGQGSIDITCDTKFFDYFPAIEHIELEYLGLTDMVGISSDSLQKLNILNNAIENITVSSFQNLSALRELTLRNNSIGRIDSDVFEPHGCIIEELDVSYNPALGDLSQHLYQSLCVLQTLNIRRTGATILPSLTHLSQSLTTLDCSDNRLVSIDGEILTVLHQLVLLNMTATIDNTGLNNGSNIGNWSAVLLPDLSSLINQHKLVTLKLEANTFICDCDVVWLYDVMDRAGAPSVSLDVAPCAGPHEFVGVSFTSIVRSGMCNIVTAQVVARYKGECLLRCMGQNRRDLCLEFSYDSTTSVCIITTQIGGQEMDSKDAFCGFDYDQSKMICA